MPRAEGATQVRARLKGVEVSRDPSGWCRVEVSLSFPGGTQCRGSAETHDTRPGLVRAGAVATLDALQNGLDDEASIELRGAKTIRAFDAVLVIVSIRFRSGTRRIDLIGAVESPQGELSRGGAHAALDAVNRVLARDLTTDSSTSDG